MIFFNILFAQLKEPAAGGKQILLRKMLAQTSAKISPPKILATSLQVVNTSEGYREEKNSPEGRRSDDQTS